MHNKKTIENKPRKNRSHTLNCKDKKARKESQLIPITS